MVVSTFAKCLRPHNYKWSTWLNGFWIQISWSLSLDGFLKATINLHTCISSMKASKASFSLMRTAMHLEHLRVSTFLRLLDALVR